MRICGHTYTVCVCVVYSYACVSMYTKSIIISWQLIVEELDVVAIPTYPIVL